MKIPYHSTRIAFADDHEFFRDGFGEFLTAQENIELVAVADDGSELLAIAEKLRPDIIFTDIKMPLMDGIAVTKKISTDFPEIGVIALTNFNAPNYLISMLQAGAKGYLLKSVSRHQVLSAIESVKRRDYYFDDVTRHENQEILAKHTDPSYIKDVFSPREKTIIKMVCDELSNKEISEKLYISERTVEGHRHRIFEKTGARNIAGIVLFAIRHGLYEA